MIPTAALLTLLTGCVHREIPVDVSMVSGHGEATTLAVQPAEVSFLHETEGWFTVPVHVRPQEMALLERGQAITVARYQLPAGRYRAMRFAYVAPQVRVTEIDTRDPGLADEALWFAPELVRDQMWLSAEFCIDPYGADNDVVLQLTRAAPGTEGEGPGVVAWHLPECTNQTAGR